MADERLWDALRVVLASGLLDVQPASRLARTCRAGRDVVEASWAVQGKTRELSLRPDALQALSTCPGVARTLFARMHITEGVSVAAGFLVMLPALTALDMGALPHDGVRDALMAMYCLPALRCLHAKIRADWNDVTPLSAAAAWWIGSRRGDDKEQEPLELELLLNGLATANQPADGVVESAARAGKALPRLTAVVLSDWLAIRLLQDDALAKTLPGLRRLTVGRQTAASLAHSAALTSDAWRFPASLRELKAPDSPVICAAFARALAAGALTTPPLSLDVWWGLCDNGCTQTAALLSSRAERLVAHGPLTRSALVAISAARHLRVLRVCSSDASMLTAKGSDADAAALTRACAPERLKLAGVRVAAAVLSAVHLDRLRRAKLGGAGTTCGDAAELVGMLLDALATARRPPGAPLIASVVAFPCAMEGVQWMGPFWRPSARADAVGAKLVILQDRPAKRCECLLTIPSVPSDSSQSQAPARWKTIEI